MHARWIPFVLMTCVPALAQTYPVPDNAAATDALARQRAAYEYVPECGDPFAPDLNVQKRVCAAAEAKKKAAFHVEVQSCQQAAGSEKLGLPLPAGAVVCSITLLIEEGKPEPHSAIFFISGRVWTGQIVK